MLQIKDITDMSEIKGIFKQDEKAVNTLLDFYDSFFSSKIIRKLNSIKKRGYTGIDIILVLLLLPYYAVSNIRALYKSGLADLCEAEKNVYYRFKNKSETNWRQLLYMLAKRFKKIAQNSGEESDNSPKCLIVDDTTHSKTGRQIEFIGKVFDHVIQKYVLGFKQLTLGYWDGKVFLPLDFSFHSERGKNEKRPYGMKRKELKRRYSKQRDSGTPGAVRVKELSENKIKNAIKMLKRAVKNGFMAQYVLADKWFMSEVFISSVRKMKRGMLHVIGLCKMDKRKYLFEGKEYSAKQLLKKYKGRKKRSRKVNAYYVEIVTEYKGIKVKLFFSRYSRRGSWHLLLTTDLGLTFNKAIEIYNIRWSIEVYFRESKQYLNLGKSASNDFDAQIADTTISMMQYLILSLYKRFHAYETMGEIFKRSQNEILEITLAQRLWVLFVNLHLKLFKLLDIDVYEIYPKLIREPEYENVVLKIMEKIDEELNDNSFNKAA